MTHNNWHILSVGTQKLTTSLIIMSLVLVCELVHPGFLLKLCLLSFSKQQWLNQATDENRWLIFKPEFKQVGRWNSSQVQMPFHRQWCLDHFLEKGCDYRLWLSKAGCLLQAWDTRGWYCLFDSPYLLPPPHKPSQLARICILQETSISALTASLKEAPGFLQVNHTHSVYFSP